MKNFLNDQDFRDFQNFRDFQDFQDSRVKLIVKQTLNFLLCRISRNYIIFNFIMKLVKLE